MRIAAILPMRGDSQRVPRKNLRQCAGRPLYHHVMATLERTREIGEIVVDTDCDEIQADVEGHFPNVRVLRRPERLEGGLVSMNDVLANTLQFVQADLVLQTHSTNPLLRSETVSAAVKALVEAGPCHDSLFSVTPRHVRLWSDASTPLNHDPAQLLRTQDLPPVYEENSCLYLFRPEAFASTHNRLGQSPLMFEMAAREALDIDDLLDFEVAEALLDRRDATMARYTLPTGVEWNERSAS